MNAPRRRAAQCTRRLPRLVRLSAPALGFNVAHAGQDAPSHAGILFLSDIAAGHGRFIIDSVGELYSWQQNAQLGDVNGDGLADFLIVDEVGRNTSNAYVVFGKTDSAPVGLAAVAARRGGGFVIRGRSPA